MRPSNSDTKNFPVSIFCHFAYMHLCKALHNGFKEVKTYLHADTMSCNKIAANQFRLFLHSAAYVVLHGIKQKLFRGSTLEAASIQTIREKILLTAVHIRVLKTKIKIEFPANHPYRDLLEKAFVACAAWREAA